MRISKSVSIFVAFSMAIFISNIPSTVLAETMISTSAVVAELTQIERIDAEINKDEVRYELQKHGVSADEISSRLASLSATELRELSLQIDQARAGGDILIAILVVVLIIYLVKRI